VPFVNPDTVAVVPDDVVAVKLPGLDFTVYNVIDEPPFATGAVHDTATCPSPLVPDTPVGAPGTVNLIRESTNPKRLNTIVLQLSDKHGVRKPCARCVLKKDMLYNIQYQYIFIQNKIYTTLFPIYFILPIYFT